MDYSVPESLAGPAGTGESRAARSMAALGRSVLRRARQAHFARAICGGLGVFALAFACAIQRGASLADPEAIALAFLLGLLAFSAWVRSETVESRDVLRRVDQRLHLAGAFLAAQESCARTPESPIAQLGAARLLQRIRPSQALEAAVPHTLGFVVLPLLGLLVLVQTVQSRDDRRHLAGRRNLEVGAVADRIGEIADEGTETLTEEQRAELAEIQREVREAARQAAEESLDALGDRARAIEDWRKEMRKIADELDALARETPSGSRVAEELSEAAAVAETLAMDSEAGDGDGSAESALAESAPAGEGQPGEGPGEGPGAGDTEGGGGGKSPGAPSADAEGPGSTADSVGPDPSDTEPDGLSGGSDPSDSYSGSEAEAKSTEGEADRTVDPDAALEGAAVASGEQAPGATSGRATGDVQVPSARPREGAATPDGLEIPDAIQEALPPAEEAMPIRPWWSGRDDGIVRAWLARQVSRPGSL